MRQKETSGAYCYRCFECGRSYPGEEDLMVCPLCAQQQEAGGCIRGPLEVVLETLPRAWPGNAHDRSFLLPFLPLRAGAKTPPMVVGGTPLRPVPRLRRELALDCLWLKDDTLNPSGSTKDRASWLVLAQAMQMGHDTVATASTGNAATSLACLAAAADLRAVTLVPASTPAAKLVQMSIYGARVLPIVGSYDQAYELCLAACDAFSWYNRNTALNPFTLEGKKSAALEIAAQLAPREADVVLVPTGDGVILAGLAKGFADLERCGLLSRQPRLIAVQPEGASALVRAFAAGSTEIPLPQADAEAASSIADSLVVEVARGAIPCLQALHSSGGAGVRVSEEEILAALAMLAASSGVFAEPAAAAALAGLLVARQQGLVEQGETIVLMVTGSGLKNLPAARRTFEPAEPLAANLPAITERLSSLPA